MGVAAAIAGAAVVGAGATVYAGSKAAKAQKNAANTADATNRYIFDTQRADSAPARIVGENALYKLADLYGVGRPTASVANGGGVTGQAGASTPFETTPSYAGFEMSPGYKFRMDEATRAIERSAAARGGLRSGATMDALQRRAQGVASDEYDTYVNRLASLAGIGQTANAQTAQAGQAYAQQQTATNMAAGQARASAYQNTGNAINQGVGNLASMYLYNQGYGSGAFGGPMSSAYAGVKA